MHIDLPRPTSMTPSTCFFLLLFLCVATGARVHPVVHPAQPAAGPTSPDVITKACELSPEKPFCISVLKSQTNGGVNDLKQAALASVKAASTEAVATSELIKVARRREENKEVVEDGIEEETLADCCMSYTSLVEKLAGAESAMSGGPGPNVSVDLKDALTTADTCEKSIAGGRKSPMVEEVAKKNDNVKKLCTNALSVYDVYAKGN
ncbi:hypothetical protein R6Q57_009901 [Mikania cordata]